VIAFEITINGEKRIVAATTPNKVLAIGLAWTHRDSDHLRFHVGGILGDGNETDNHFDWEIPEPKLGDDISIRIIETDAPDEPDRIYRLAESADRE